MNFSKIFQTMAIQPEILQISAQYSGELSYQEDLLAALAQVFGIIYHPHLNPFQK